MLLKKMSLLVLLLSPSAYAFDVTFATPAKSTAWFKADTGAANVSCSKFACEVSVAAYGADKDSLYAKLAPGSCRIEEKTNNFDCYGEMVDSYISSEFLAGEAYPAVKTFVSAYKIGNRIRMNVTNEFGKVLLDRRVRGNFSGCVAQTTEGEAILGYTGQNFQSEPTIVTPEGDVLSACDKRPMKVDLNLKGLYEDYHLHCDNGKDTYEITLGDLQLAPDSDMANPKMLQNVFMKLNQYVLEKQQNVRPEGLGFVTSGNSVFGDVSDPFGIRVNKGSSEGSNNNHRYTIISKSVAGGVSAKVSTASYGGPIVKEYFFKASECQVN